MKILIIDDEEMIRSTMAVVLTNAKYDVIKAADGKTGLAILEQYHPDLILCDINMPQMDGYTVLKTVRSNPQFSSIPFIFLTGFNERSRMRIGMELGADDYLVKPCTVEELINSVNTRIEKHRNNKRQIESKLNELRQNITTILPHEFLTPLSVILGYSLLLRDYRDSLEKDEIGLMANGIYQNSQRLNRLIQNFLLVAELEIVKEDQQKIQLLRHELCVSPEPLLAEVITKAAAGFERIGDLTLQVSSQKYNVAINEARIAKIAEELVNNAFRYSTPGSPILVTMRLEKGEFVLEVQDKGHGMKAEQIRSIAGFVQFNRELHEQQGGGLGLTLVKRLCQIYNGELNLISIPEMGTIANVSLPLAQ
ncbi:MAG: response regulator [Chloroflexi bacterium]|uniref:histidine kinase n=1 Tax=Candidatus Chlorohelix allophototropha TaxID=3003348 RepID=A0A8T7M921_9CHLR|nr:response regulator [Chloroflexota bacterium]WJW68485.1 response regulator [Chloroflexota bacterium L227-S17]